MIKKGNEYFSKDSAYTAEYIINDILSDTNYKFLGDVGKQFLQEKINALPDNPKKTALQDQFNIQVLNISQKTHAENPPLQESARNATSSSTKIDTPQTEIIKKLVSSAGLLHQLKNAVLIAWNIGRELIFGKQDKTSARSDPSRPETAKNSVNAAQEPPAKNKTIGSIVSGMMSSAKNFLSTAIGFKPATKTEAVMTVTAPIITSAPVAPPTTTLPADTTSSKKHSTSSILSLLDGKNCNVSNAASKSLKERIKEIDKLITSQIEYVKLSCNHFSHPDVADDLKEHIRSLHALKQQAACSGPKDQAHITNALQEIQLKIANEINTSPSNSTYKTIMENVQKEELTDKGVIPKAITEQHSIAVRGANSVVEAIHSGIKRSF